MVLSQEVAKLRSEAALRAAPVASPQLSTRSVSFAAAAAAGLSAAAAAASGGGGGSSGVAGDEVIDPAELRRQASHSVRCTCASLRSLTARDAFADAAVASREEPAAQGEGAVREQARASRHAGLIALLAVLCKYAAWRRASRGRVSKGGVRWVDVCCERSIVKPQAAVPAHFCSCAGHDREVLASRLAHIASTRRAMLPEMRTEW